MNVKVVYHSKTGNTKKVAQTIAATLGCQVEAIGGESPAEKLDFLFIGAAVYATHGHGLDPVVVDYIKRLKPGCARKVALFCTGFSSDAINRMKGTLRAEGFDVAPESFHCEGRFLFFKHGHPDAADFARAAEFARRVIAN